MDIKEKAVNIVKSFILTNTEKDIPWIMYFIAKDSKNIAIIVGKIIKINVNIKILKIKK